MRLIIAGGRDFDDLGKLEHTFYKVYPYQEFENTVTELVSGKAKGADSLGEVLAKRHDIPVKEFHADWNTHGKAAGPIRNKQMGDYADELLAFWDGKSVGTKHMIDYMTSLGKPVWIRTYKPKTKKARPKK